ncbi:MAG: hypothetical protein A3D67_00585 [Candidatus Lloydbacteria bacterium RIFCSPHIGHO2_02_FULL_51_22]|nr:MAG: hypothetical protein A3D67_00585 [Candidatus Lloydbacteria bacterium RIFCSPHIGHO2_02_FULL_51_22]OGZ16438.1 MAG: hypothetical protein A3G11_00925 [Candidatus Lloydbacteria bacterium RIFCSPLOWO2_12_FULL_51_9]
MAETLSEGGEPVHLDGVFKEWAGLIHFLARVGAALRFLQPHSSFPDIVFTANAGFVHAEKLFLSRFRHEERRGESAIVHEYFTERLGIPVVVLPEYVHDTEGQAHPVFFEGQGDVAWYGKYLVCGYGIRSNFHGIVEFVGRTAVPCVTLELVDEHFYHLDTCFCPMGNDILWYPQAFSTEAQEKVQELVQRTNGHLTAASAEDARHLACNGLYFEPREGYRVLITSPLSTKLYFQLDRLGIRVWQNDVSEFLKSGGGNRCLVLLF